MKTLLQLATMSILLAGCARQDIAVSPFELPPGVTYETEPDVEFHSFRWGTTNGISTGLFMMSPHPAGLNEATLAGYAKNVVPQLETELRAIDGVTDLTMETRDFSAGEFSGQEIIFVVKMSDGTTTYQTMHILGDGVRGWMGQLTGTGETDLAMVRTILKARTGALRTR